MGLPILITVFIADTRSYRLNTGPGRGLDLINGRAEIRDRRDIPVMLQREDATIEVPASQMDWLPDWLNELDELHPPVAKLVLPEGYGIGFNEQGKFFLATHPVFRNENGRTAEEEETYQQELAVAS